MFGKKEEKNIEDDSYLQADWEGKVGATGKTRTRNSKGAGLEINQMF